jgi:hypothetical protein
VALLDASYGLYDVAQSAQWDKLQTLFSLPTLCPVPPSGRAVELAMLLARQGHTDIALDAPADMLRQMVEHDDGSLRLGAAELRNAYSDFRHFLAGAWCWPPIPTARADGRGLRARSDFHHRTLFTGHLNRVARQQWQNGDVDFCRWNVHPTVQSLQALVTAWIAACCSHCLRRLRISGAGSKRYSARL